MPHYRDTEVPDTREREFDPLETNGTAKYTTGGTQ